MKKWMAWLLVFCLGMAFLPLSFAVKEHSSGPWQYILLEDGTVEITAYWGKDENLVIPEEFEGKKVTSIGEYAICNNDEMESVTFPDSVTTLKTGTFLCCASLAGITIPDTITNIPGNPFLRCYTLTEIFVSPDHPTLEVIDGVLFSKQDRRLICYPYAFTADYPPAVTHYEIPEGTRVIGDNAFYKAGLYSVGIPDSVEEIGAGAFMGCGFLKEISLPGSVRKIGDSAFESCFSLTSVRIPEGVEEIGSEVFYACLFLEEILLPESLLSIGDYAFDWCHVLTSIRIPDSVVRMGSNPFRLCSELTEITVSPDHPYLEYVDGVLFSKPDRRLICYSTALPEGPYEIPEGTQVIGSEAFRNCENLTGLTIPDSVRTIGEGAFSNCVSLKELVIPFGVTTIGLFAFSGCGSLVRLTIPGSVTNIDDRALYPEDFRTVIVTKGSYAQWFCDSHGIACEFAEGNP